MVSRVISLVLSATVASCESAEGAHISPMSQDIAELLASARGVAPAMCVLAADGVSSWSGHGGVPVEAVTSDVRSRLRDLSRGEIVAEDSRALLAGLASTDACERHLAATLIGRSRGQSPGTGGQSLTQQVVARLSSPSKGERGSVLYALGLLRAKSEVGAISRALRDASPDVRSNAAWALGRIRDRSATGAVAAAARDADARVRVAAVSALGHLEADSVQLLVGILKSDPSDEVRRVAAWALGVNRNREAATALSAALQSDRSDDVREMSAWALAQLRQREGAVALTAALKQDRSRAVRETAAWALGNLRERESVDALAGAVGTDADAEVRGAAAWAIGQMHRGKAPASLIKAIRDEDSDVRLKAAWALSEIADPDAAAAIADAMKTEQMERVRKAEVRALVHSGARSEEALRSLLESSDAETRAMAVRAFAGRRGLSPWPWPWPRPRPFP